MAAATKKNAELIKDDNGKAVGIKYKSFNVKIEVDEFGHEERLLEFNTVPLRNFMRDNINLENVYDDLPVISATELFTVLDTIKYKSRRTDNGTTADELIEFLEKEHGSILGRLANLTKAGNISFGLLKSYLTVGTEIEIYGDEIYGGRVVSSEYRQSFFGVHLQISYEYISTNGRTFIQCRDTVQIPRFNGVKEISKLPVKILSPEVKAELNKRGELYARVAIGPHYMQYSGQMQVKKWWSWDSMRSDGRIMVDPATYVQFKDEYSERNEEDTHLTTIDEDRLWMTEPFIKGFSFSTKQWGRFAIARVEDIQFRDDAFDKLVLDSEKKNLIKALVTNSAQGFSDIISGKGGGCIFLLHGEPGTGKTLTAEAISELLRRPLYSVSVGELGITPEQLEESLRQILDVAQIWNAVILIDEADIFLEARTSGDILRNAMCSVMLRLFEYHQGILFLTTNRVGDFDTAFYSRISVALKYQGLDETAREQIWTNLLAAANITGLNPARLAETEINGRQIKNTIRLAQSLARQAGVDVSFEHVQQTLAISQQFITDLKDMKKV